MIDIDNIHDQNMNDFFRTLKNYCKGLNKEKFVWARRILDIDKKDIIIFEADFKKIDFDIINNTHNSKLLMPTDKVFIEIPKWHIDTKEVFYMNCGGVFIFNEKIGENNLITIYTFWFHFDKQSSIFQIKPISMSYKEKIPIKPNVEFSEANRLKMGTSWEKPEVWINDFEENMKKELLILSSKLLHYLLIKIEKK